MSDAPWKFATRILLASVTLAAFASGCSAEVPGRARALPDLELGRFVDRPCSLLTPSQLTQLGDFPAPVPEQEPDRSNCKLNPRKVMMPGYSLILRTKVASFESARDNLKSSPVYRETDVAGYPAFSYSGTDSAGVCSTFVRASSKDAIQVTVVGEPELSPELVDSCNATEKVATIVVTNLKS